MTICYFTATGNSLYVARRIGGELRSIPQMMKQEQIEIADDAVGVVCPVYGGEMPKMVRRFLEKATIQTEYFFFISTYGMSDSVAKFNAVAAAKRSGMEPSYVESIIMVDNYLPGFEMRHQMDTVGEKQIEAHLDAICRDIAERKVQVPSVGTLQKLGMRAVHSAMAKNILKDTAAQSYLVNDNCIRCGVCAKVCPTDNITVTEGGVQFSDHCEVCYACLHNCPKNAIHLKNERSAVRFRNAEISLNDIIQANG